MKIKHFIDDECGAFTVDWVVLAAGLVGFGMAVVVLVGSGFENKSTDVSHSLANMDPLTHHEGFGDDPDV